MSPTRAVKCQKCVWKGVRRYGPDGILSQPCPVCGRLVTYADQFSGDQPVTQDIGQELRPAKVSKWTPERRAQQAAILAKARSKARERLAKPEPA